MFHRLSFVALFVVSLVTGAVVQAAPVRVGVSDWPGWVAWYVAKEKGLFEKYGAEVELVELERRENRLKTALTAAAGDYDFILIDCPPSLSMLTLNGLCSAHGVVVPMQCEYFALEGLTDLVNTIKQIHANLNPDLQIIGLLRVMFDPRITLQQQVSDQLKAHFGDKVFTALIPRNVRLAEAPSYGQPGVVFDPAAKGAQAYLEFARELVQRVKLM